MGESAMPVDGAPKQSTWQAAISARFLVVEVEGVAEVLLGGDSETKQAGLEVSMVW
jgi:hypothetical protein